MAIELNVNSHVERAIMMKVDRESCLQNPILYYLDKIVGFRYGKEKICRIDNANRI